MTRAMVLSGGSIKGAYQAGVIHSVVHEAGYCPDIVTGISTGSLCSAYLVNDIGKQLGPGPRRKPTLDHWKAATESLLSFYRTRVTSQDVLIESRDGWSIGWGALTGNFNGLVSTAPLRGLIYGMLDPDQMRRPDVVLSVGAVNIASGAIEYADAFSPNIEDYVYASTAEPLIMPLVNVAGGLYYDGGMRDIIPLKQAIALGADEIVVIACQPRELKAHPVKPKNVIALAERITDIICNETLLNDLDVLETKNRMVAMAAALERADAAALNEATRGEGVPYRQINARVIMPENEIVVSISDFNSGDIENMIQLGIDQGRRAVQSWT